MKTPEPCLQCHIPDNPGKDVPTPTPVCNPLLCPKTLRTGPVRRSSTPRRRIPPAAPAARSTAPPQLLEVEPGEDEETETAAMPDIGTYRRVTNRAGKTVIARAGVRNCDPRCRNARGNVCVCSCKGRNHGIGY